MPEDRRFSNIVSARKVFGFDTRYRAKVKKSPKDLLVYQNGGYGYVSRKFVRSGDHLIDKWKLFVNYAGPGSDVYPHMIISNPFVGGPNAISTETYLCIGPFDQESEAENARSYLSCRLSRFLILLSKTSQHVTRRVYRFLPKQDYSHSWSDEMLYKKYRLSSEDIKFIEKFVRPMNTENGERNE